MSLIQIELGNSEFVYFQNQLSRGNAYAKQLLPFCSHGRLVTFLPEEIIDEKIDFSNSIALTYGINIYAEVRKTIYDFVASFLQVNGRLAFIETYYYPREVPELIGGLTIVTFENEVYYVLRSEERLEKIKEAFSSARDYPFICGLIDMKDNLETIIEGQQLTREKLQIWLENTQLIIIGAFDNEGFLVWIRQ
jgi:hypothetical protein